MANYTKPVKMMYTHISINISVIFLAVVIFDIKLQEVLKVVTINFCLNIVGQSVQ